jgi:hypothetical protein
MYLIGAVSVNCPLESYALSSIIARIKAAVVMALASTNESTTCVLDKIYSRL